MIKIISSMVSVYRLIPVVTVLGILIFPQVSASKDIQGNNDVSADKKYRAENSYSADITSSEHFVFADNEEYDDEGGELTEEDRKEFSKYEEGIETHENVMTGNFESLEKAEGYETLLDGKEDDIASLAILKNVEKSINEAKIYHNMKQMLPDFKKTFQELKDAREYHDKTVEYLQSSQECISRYLKPHYEEASKSWFGNDCGFFGTGTVYCHYNPEKEIGDETESKGIYDDTCPDDTKHLCYIKKLEEHEYKSGISGLLLKYYEQGKEEDALQETQTYLREGEQEEGPTETVEQVSDNEYTAQVNVESSSQENGVDEGVYVSGRDDTNAMDADNLNTSEIVPDVDDTKNNMKKEVEAQEADTNEKDPKKAEALAEETRKSHLMNWVWGAQVAADISRDLDSNSPRFGTRIKRFPLWNDQKEFYDQYIDGKFDNIKAYIKDASMPDALLAAAKSINAKLNYKPIVIKNNLGKEKVRIKKSEITAAIKKALLTIKKKEFDLKDTTKEAIDKLIVAENKALAALKAQHDKKMATLTNKKEKLQVALAKANEELSDVNEEVNKESGTVASSVNTDRITKDNEASNKALEDKYTVDVDLQDSPMNKKFSEEKESSDKNKTSAKKERQTKLRLAETKEKNSKRLSDELKKVKDDIEKERRNFVKDYAQLEEKLRSTFDEKVENTEVPVVLDSTVIARMTEVINKASETLSRKYKEEITLPLTAATLSGEMIACLRKEAVKIVEKTKSDLDNMKKDESIYYLSNASKVKSAHKSMINKMKSISSCAAGGVSSAPIAKEVFGDMCDDVSCLKEDTGANTYFVGALPLKYDLKTPNKPVQFSSAPMREVFHLDLEDYDNLEKYYENEEELDNNSNIYITADGFLNSGLELPEIWRYVLKRHAYVQKQFNLVRLLGNSEYGDDVRGDPDQNYLRSGSFPCYIGSKVVDVGSVYKLRRSGFKWTLIFDRFGYSVNKTKDINLYNKVPCQGFTLKGNKVIDYAVDASPSGGNVTPNLKGLISETSELGTVLAYIPDTTVEALVPFLPSNLGNRRKLTFNASMQKAVGLVSDAEDMDDDKEKEALFYLANRTFFDRNQFGDFLNQYEQEAIARDSLIKVENQIEGIIQNLQDIFYGTGIVITEDFDLLKDSDYKAAADALDEQKKIYMNKAEKEIQKVKGATQSTKEKAEALLHSLAVLAADSDEVVQVSGREDLSDLAARIKNRQADNAVIGKYDEEGRKAHDRRLRQLQPPYCEVHVYK